MKHILLIISLLIISFAKGYPGDENKQHVYFKLNLTDRKSDQFKVVVLPKGLTEKNTIFQFAATVPGVYQTHNIGRYIQDFKAFDESGNELSVARKTINQFKLFTPKKIKRIEYSVNETWQTKVDSNTVFDAAGTSFEDDYALINSHAIFGYFKDMQSTPITLKLTYPEEWELGTALIQNTKGEFTARNFDHLVDSPILLGKLTKVTTNINGTVIDVYAYSKSGKVNAEMLLNSMKASLEYANTFLHGFPVEHYTFLFLLSEINSGAWEHSLSSGYVLREYDYKEFETHMVPMALHEFFHIITPLNIHSEIIESFNFVQPVPSDHLWLYEGTVEWMTNMSLFRSGDYTLRRYLDKLKGKIFGDNFYGTDFTLIELARSVYMDKGKMMFRNIYDRGALVAGLLDIKLLELSNGKRGLRDVLNELTKKYGPNKPFNERTFFNDITKMTYPEIGEFFTNYIKNAKPLPYSEYYAKIGIKYHPAKAYPGVVDFGFTTYNGRNGVTVHMVQPDTKKIGLKLYDAVKEINGVKITVDNFDSIKNEILKGGIGTRYKMKINRFGKEIEFDVQTVTKKVEYFFEPDQAATKEQLSFREKWMKKL